MNKLFYERDVIIVTHSLDPGPFLLLLLLLEASRHLCTPLHLSDPDFKLSHFRMPTDRNQYRSFVNVLSTVLTAVLFIGAVSAVIFSITEFTLIQTVTVIRTRVLISTATCGESEK
jgi:hypothetical protein